MSSLFSGTLTGEGIAVFPGGLDLPTDMDIEVTIVGAGVYRRGLTPHRIFKGVGWIQFFNTTFGNEAVTEPLWINSELQDKPISTVLGAQADAFFYSITPGSAVHVSVSN